MSATPSILVRALGPTGDVLWGQGQNNFVANAQAVGQLILTRLRLFEGEWWADLTDGLPVFQSILGRYLSSGNTINAISLLIQQRILGTAFVTGISNVQASFDPNTRRFSFFCVVLTQFGPIAITLPAISSGQLGGYGVLPYGTAGMGQ